MQSKIHFFGGAGSVTGANFLFETGSVRFLVDCGLAQGRHNAEEDNWKPFQYDPASIPLLIVTHAHIDHIGRIPKLVRDGFRGKIISTEVTRALAGPLLFDSQELLAHDAKKHGREELYSDDDIHKALSLWEAMPYHTMQEVGEGISFEFLDAGHILGSAMVRFVRGDRSIVFTGDLGGGNSPLLPAYEKLSKTNYLVMESVYGDRTRTGEEDPKKSLKHIIDETLARHGTLLIPAFSTERTQDILFDIRSLVLDKSIPSIPVYVDSPLAQKVTSAYLEFPQYFSAALSARIKGGENIFSFPNMHMIDDAESSRKLAFQKGSKIIIAGSGMSNGGRVHSHEKVILPDKNSTVLIVGYQAAGSLGRRLVEGDKNVLITGERVKVAAKIETLYGYSAHMDSPQLLEFVHEASEGLEHAFVVMGEPAASGFLVQRIRDYLGLHATAPVANEEAIIDF